MDRVTVQAFEQRLVDLSVVSLQNGGRNLRPVMQMFREGQVDQPYVGAVTCRRYRDGDDAGIALVGFGMPAQALAATRLVLLWEDASLRASLQGPGDYQNCLVTVDCHLQGMHVMTRHPFMPLLGTGADGEPSIDPAFHGPPQDWGAAVLPKPFELALDVWRNRTALPLSVETVVAHQTEAGYAFRWATTVA
jgi:hypothetical protein